MTYEQQYTYLDGAWHAIGWGEHTMCNIAIPHGNGYGLLPDGAKAHCGPDTKIAETEVDDDPAENKAIADKHAAERVGEPVETVTGEVQQDKAGDVGPVEAKTTKASPKKAK